VALLLPDARVITAGSNPHRKDDELRLELFHPPYLFRGSRPFIEHAPSVVHYGDVVTLKVPQAKDIKWVELVHPGATTHSSDTSQRLVDMPFEREGFCRLKTCLPKEPNLAPSGWYMLFIVDHRGVPSVAKWVRLLSEAVSLWIHTLPAVAAAKARPAARPRPPPQEKGTRAEADEVICCS
jgi:hypothetical protein